MGCGNSDAGLKLKDVIGANTRVANLQNTDLRKNFELISMLGNGAFGKVRLYRDKRNKDVLYAIKTLKKEGIPAQHFRLLKNEVRILSELDHPNIVKYFATLEDDYYVHILMEYLKGHDLYKVIATKNYTGFDEKDMCLIIHQILLALFFIHGRSIIHRDIKPENILFSDKNDYSSLKLIDFGLATTKVDHKSAGTPYYMAPEILRAQACPQSDVWSVGVIVHLMLTGKFPFAPGDGESIFAKIKGGVFNHAVLNRSNCSDEAKDFVCRCLEKDFEKRITTKECLEHPWMKKFITNKDSNLLNMETVETLKAFSHKTTLQKEMYFFLAKISREKEILRLKELFYQLGTEKTGVISMREIKDAFGQIGIVIKEDELAEIYQGLDFHNNGRVNYSEFLAAMISSYKFEKEEKLWSVFNYFKDDGEKEKISYDSFKSKVVAFNLTIDEQTIKDCFDGCKGGLMDFAQFKSLIIGDEVEVKRKKSSEKKLPVVDEANFSFVNESDKATRNYNRRMTRKLY